MQGTIIQLKHGIGKIEGEDGQRYKFNRKTTFVTGSPKTARRLQKVIFDPDGAWAADIQLLDEFQTAPAKPKPAPKPKPAAQAEGYRFLNPYNFVRSLRPPQTLRGDPDTQLLHRCPPPPHDRYVGLTGEIKCTLENVTPLFVSDSHATQGKKNEHRTFRFFQVENEDGERERAIPATSIRGMVRGAFEAVTNSCYAVFDYDKRLSYHLPATDALKLVPGRAEKDAQGRWRLRLLPGSARLAVGERPRDKLYAGRVEQYEAIAPGRRRKRGRYRPPPSKPVALNGLKHGDECFALADDLKFPPVWNVRAVAPHEKDLRVTPGKKQRVLRGYLAITNQNIETKRFERFFFRAPGNTSCPEFAPLTQDVRTKYKELIQDYQDRHADAIRKRKEDGGHPAKTHPARDADGRRVTEAAFSRFIIGGKVELQDGDLVYAMLSGSSQAPRVIFIVPVAIPRVGYERKIAQLLPEHLWKCEEYDELCPACRTFGWVYGQEKGDREDQKQSIPIPENKTTAYAGRVRFSHARQQGKVETFKTSLTILSSPKPTTTRFYLKPSAGPPEDGLDDYRAGYDYRDNVLRGRKFYRHHGHSGDKNYWQDQKCEYRKTGKNSDQNRTVEDALAPGAAFGFSIAFENLSQVELGALLWALQMEGAQYHRLGYGKALGFGSVRLGVEQVTVLDMPARYQTLAETDDDEMPVEKQTEITQQFKDAMRRAYGQSFEALPHVQDLLALLSDPKPDLPIHYPRANQRPDPKGKNFEWFVGNHRNKNARYALELPGQEEGFPLIDRYGKEKLR